MNHNDLIVISVLHIFAIIVLTKLVEMAGLEPTTSYSQSTPSTYWYTSRFGVFYKVCSSSTLEVLKDFTFSWGRRIRTLNAWTKTTCVTITPYLNLTYVQFYSHGRNHAKEPLHTCLRYTSVVIFEEGVGLEPTQLLHLTVFKTAARRPTWLTLPFTYLIFWFYIIR